MECFVLGSGGMMPMPRRRLTSVAVRREGQVYLLDCGEGTQLPYKELHLGQRALRLVAVTHLHADHCLGLPGMLMLRAQMPDPGPLTVLGPPGLGEFVRHVRRDLAMFINYPVQVRHFEPDGPTLAHEDEHFRIRWLPLRHTVLCLGYRLDEHPRPGRFDPEAAAGLGVPRGPDWGRLQRGEAVALPGGGTVRPEQVLGPARRGLSVAYVTDTAPCPGAEELLAGADLAFVEGMFLGEHTADAAEKKHMTVAQSAAMARRAGVERLVLVHVSPRYTEEDLPRLREEAARHHPNVTIARDGQQITLTPPE